jgi:hypothetical protein
VRKVVERRTQMPAGEKVSEEDTQRFIAEATGQAGKDYAVLSPAAKDALANRFAREAVADAGLRRRLGAIFGAYDVLWLALALGSAFKLASGSSCRAD